MHRIAETILAGGRPTFDVRLLAETVSSLSGQVAAGYGKTLDSVAWDTPDGETIGNLTRNVYQFSAAKNYQQLRDMTLALHDGERLLSESEYFQRIDAMNIQYNRTWLRTERDTAIAGGQMASRWVQFEKEKDILPCITYRTVGDSHVRREHQLLDGITKPLDDPFWTTYYPPNGYNCRCDVEQAPPDAKPTLNSHIQTPNIPVLFRTNLAKAGLIFPKGHPYYIDVPGAEIRKAIAYLPPENAYMTVKSAHGDSLIDLHIMHNNAEVTSNLEVADDLLKAGYKNIRLLPDIHQKDAHLRKKFLPKRYTQTDIRKNPDCWLQDGKGRNMICDFKVLSGERNFAVRISEAAVQAEYAVIKLKFERKGLSDVNIKKIVEMKMQAHENLKGVIVIDEEGEIIYRKTR